MNVCSELGIARNYCTILYIIVRGHFKTSTGSADMTVNDKRGQLEVSGTRIRAHGVLANAKMQVATTIVTPATGRWQEVLPSRTMSRKGSSFIRCNSQKKTDSSNYKSHSLFMFSFHVMCYVWGNRMVFGLGIEETGETQQLLKEKRLLYLWKPSDTTPNFL